MIPCRVGLVVSVSTSHTVGRGFAYGWVIPKTIIKMVQTASLHRHACVTVGVWQCSLTVLKGRVVCGTVYGDMHLKDLLGSFSSVGYCIPVPDFYLVHATWSSLPKKHYNGLINQSAYDINVEMVKSHLC